VIIWSDPAVYLAPVVKRPSLEVVQRRLEIRTEAVARIVFHYSHETYHEIEKAATKLEGDVAPMVTEGLQCAGAG
jgi:hypothetical protein